MNIRGGVIQRTTITVNTGDSGIIRFPDGQCVINAIFDNYNILFINHSDQHDYAAYYIRGTTLSQVPLNTNVTVTYDYIKRD